MFRPSFVDYQYSCGKLISLLGRLLISSWYKPSEIAVRVAIVYCGNTVANGFGGILAAGILSGLDGKGGLEGWR